MYLVLSLEQLLRRMSDEQSLKTGHSKQKVTLSNLYYRQYSICIVDSSCAVKKIK